MRRIAKMIRDSSNSKSNEDKKLAELEEKLLDAIEPILMKENTIDRMAIAGTILKVAMITYQQDLGEDGVADLLVEVANQVDEGLLSNVQQIANKVRTIH